MMTRGVSNGKGHNVLVARQVVLVAGWAMKRFMAPLLPLERDIPKRDTPQAIPGHSQTFRISQKATKNASTFQTNQNTPELSNHNSKNAHQILKNLKILAGVAQLRSSPRLFEVHLNVNLKSCKSCTQSDGPVDRPGVIQPQDLHSNAASAECWQPSGLMASDGCWMMASHGWLNDATYASLSLKNQHLQQLVDILLTRNGAFFRSKT